MSEVITRKNEDLAFQKLQYTKNSRDRKRDKTKGNENTKKLAYKRSLQCYF